MKFDGFAADHELVGDLPVRQPGGDETGHHRFGRGELAGAGTAADPAAEPLELRLSPFEVGPGPISANMPRAAAVWPTAAVRLRTVREPSREQL